MVGGTTTTPEVRCVECGKVRHGGSWREDPVERGPSSHTMCPGCASGLLHTLATERDFRTWSLPRQIQALLVEIEGRPVDREGLQRLLDRLGVKPGLRRSKIVDLLVERLEREVCPYCGLSLGLDRVTLPWMEAGLHAGCALKLQEGLTIVGDLLDGNPAHLDAWLDYARIPHAVRDGVRKVFAENGCVASGPGCAVGDLPLK